jgi:alpha-L-fucosidase
VPKPIGKQLLLHKPTPAMSRVAAAVAFFQPRMPKPLPLQTTKEPEPQKEQKEQMEPLVRLGTFGVMVHWGLYSVPAFDSVEIAMTRSIQNGSEWYLKRLSAEPGSFRPTSGWKETQAYHDREYGKDFKYEQFAEEFTTASCRCNFDEWMATFKTAGATYVVLTTKHHDGFCLWPTKTNSLCHDKRNLVGDFCTAARKAGLKIGLYYSWTEFNRSATKVYVDSVMKPQIDELIQYKPDLFWFDGDWSCTTKYAQQGMDDCCTKIRKILPTCHINDRIGHKQERLDRNYLGLSTYRTYDDRCTPLTKPDVPWERVDTIGYSWGRNRQQRPEHCKSVHDLRQMYRTCRSVGGRLLLNVGPNPDGSLDPLELEKLQFKITTAGPLKPEFNNITVGKL